MADADPKRACVGGGSTRDRLSALPDELLHRILSFLPAQQVVRTTVLSKRWTDLWRFVPGINLSFSDFRSHLEEDWKAGWGRMEGFANNLLMLHRAPCLDAFRLDVMFDGHDQRRHVDRWIRRAIKDNPLVLELSVPHSAYQLPHLGSSPYRRLRRLHLGGTTLDHSFAERLHSWWPDLKDLSIRFCRIGFCGIESDKLESLALECPIRTIRSADVFAIRAPHLTSLFVRSILFSLDVGNSIVKASICLEPFEFSPRSGTMLLGRLFNVTSFELGGLRGMVKLAEEFDEVPIFQNLTTLSLELRSNNLIRSAARKIKTVGRFLQKFPNLERLTMKNFEVVSVVELEHLGFPVLENLKTLCLYFCDLHFEVLLRCLQNSPNLEKLTIRYCELSDDSTRGKGKGKSKQTYSQSRNLARFQCLKLKCTEIVHSRDHAGVPELVGLLMDIAATKIIITDTSM